MPFSVKRVCAYKLSLLRNKYMLILLFAIEACSLLARQIMSIKFTLTRIFPKLSHRSPRMVTECLFFLAFYVPKVRYLVILLVFAEVYCV